MDLGIGLGGHMKFIWIERDTPIFAAILLGLFKPIVLGVFGKYDHAFWASDIAFSGLSFDLWAFISLVVYRHDFVDKGRNVNGKATLGERILVGFFGALHFLLYIIAFGAPSSGVQAKEFYENNVVLLIFLSGFATFILPALLVRRVFQRM